MEIIKKTACIASLIAVVLLALSFNALGVEYPVGSGNDDWWTTYPDQSSAAGEDIGHPSWVIDALKSKPVLIYVHKSCDWSEPLRVDNELSNFNSW
ncbi:MAG TPA: hypothetical protein PLN19_04245, partial [Methanothrix sp.]|nr:hypothetical protein [Methanothrix sp.]HQE87466.1 hypothetical protein [Methanothrix sp.]HQI68990.1 hypothetical protein [Methanothrix sp.]HRS85165.1 hypothetical protein [Methanothrix sp.]HRT17281.1 hypothetical protein [Methanothrix sp.]